MFVDIEKLQKETLLKVAKSRDELFHMKFYEWLINNNLSFLLMDLETPFILVFLEARFMEHSDACKDLLWKYLARHGRYFDAARVLNSLVLAPEL